MIVAWIVKAVLGALRVSEFESDEDSRAHFFEADSAVEEAMDNEPVRFIVETQFLLADYLNVRRETHFWSVTTCYVPGAFLSDRRSHWLTHSSHSCMRSR